MQRPIREEFILDVRRAECMLQMPKVEADSNRIDTDAIARILDRAVLWLTPKVVEHYRPEDFAGWSSERKSGCVQTCTDSEKSLNRFPQTSLLLPTNLQKDLAGFAN